jgi:hypothetical protein
MDKVVEFFASFITLLLVFMIISIPSIVNYDTMKPAFAQDMVFAEPEEEENGGPYDDDDDNYPDFNFVVAGDIGCGGKPERTVSRVIG